MIFFIKLMILSLGASELRLQEVLISSQKSFPMILNSLEELRAAKMKQRQAEGAFDLNLKSKIDKRTDGYYDGESADVSLVKPLKFLSSKVYTGYRVSNGNYPDYEGKYDTLNNGEYRGGVSLSLWRDSFIDEKRLKLWNTQFDIDTKELKLALQKIKVEKEARKAYWAWVAKGNVYLVYKNLLDIAQKRDTAIKKKVKRGDLASIYRTENQQYIVKRKTQVSLAKKEFQNSAINLSLFYRDQEGEPLTPSIDQLPEGINGETVINQEKLKQDITQALQLSPEIQTIEALISKEDNKARYGSNLTQPKLDLSFEVSKDYGQGSRTLKTTENRAMLSIEIPIERNLGKGYQNNAKANQMALRHQKKLLRDQVNITIKTLFNELNTSYEVIGNTKQEIEFAEKLQEAEYKKFNQGASDFFVINIREQNLADAKIKNIKAHLDYKKSMAEYDAITFQSLKN